MKLINENPWQYLSVKLPMLGAFFMLVLIPLLQWALDFQLIPEEHEAVVIGIVIPLLGLIGKKIYQPELHAPQLNGINSLLATPQNSNDLAWMIEAKKHIGLREIVGKQHNKTILGWIKGLGGWFTDDETPWCGTFVAHCLKTAGVKYPKHWYRALDYVNYGSKLTKPAYGCVAIKTRKGGGHVCFVVGRDQKTKKLVCLGGNQSNAVSYALYSDGEFQEFRWYGKTSRPAESRYNLELLDGVSATKVSEV
ncbi:TIGR02594 family protein [Acinetobacter sichuanensis]|uniref:NlpC/P60 family protein n=1 Tax=Acinetobacter sichuanensis TaxID=2136183 RepID=UPI0028100A94|nr:TIGR02594 family protein [Acinetobacter sichuanensis]MDQ9023162.1 TIGR02594 family protein [Acinetobacter sichuanensis]